MKLTEQRKFDNEMQYIDRRAIAENWSLRKNEKAYLDLLEKYKTRIDSGEVSID